MCKWHQRQHSPERRAVSAITTKRRNLSISRLRFPNLEVELLVVGIVLELDHLDFIFRQQVDLVDQVVLQLEKLVFSVLGHVFIFDILSILILLRGIVGEVLRVSSCIDSLSVGNLLLVTKVDMAISLDFDRRIVIGIFVL